MAIFFFKVILLLWIFYIDQKHIEAAATGSKQELCVRVPRQIGFKSLFERPSLPPSPEKKNLRLQCQEYEDIEEIPKAISSRSSGQKNLKLRRHFIYDYLRLMLERVQAILKAFAEYRGKIPEIANKLKLRNRSKK